MNDHTSRHRILTPALLAFTLAAGLCTAPAASAAGFELERELDQPGVRAVLVGAHGRDPREFRGLCFQMVTRRAGGADRARCEGGSETLA